MKNIKVALVHDYLREYGGAERVVEDLHEIFPDAPLFTSYYNPKALGKNAEHFRGWDIKTSWVQHVPFANRLISPFRIFAPLMFQSFDFTGYDLVISSDAIYFPKSINVPKGTLHICYIHTPPRYLYGYATSYNYKKHWWTRIGGEIMNHFLRIWDFEFAQKPDILVANSKNIQSRIKKFYRRDAVVIYPGTDVEKLKTESLRLKTAVKDYYLCLGRLVRSKGVEIAIEACNKLKIPLKVAGTGPLLSELKKMAGPTVQILGGVSDEERVELLTNAKALLLLEEEPDFGITSVEAQACGTPVIALKVGGYLETVIDPSTSSGRATGMFFGGDRGSFGCAQGGQTTVDSLVKALQNFNNLNYLSGEETAKACRKNAEKFSKEKFKKEILELVEKHALAK